MPATIRKAAVPPIAQPFGPVTASAPPEVPPCVPPVPTGPADVEAL